MFTSFRYINLITSNECFDGSSLWRKVYSVNNTYVHLQRYELAKIITTIYAPYKIEII